MDTHRGDVRAVITVAPAELSAAAGGPLAAVVQWRRRDAHPEGKAVIVTDSVGRELGNVTTPVVEQDRGVIVFTPTPGQTQAGFSTNNQILGKVGTNPPNRSATTFGLLFAVPIVLQQFCIGRPFDIGSKRTE